MGRQKAALLAKCLHEEEAHRCASHRLTVAGILSWEATKALAGVPVAELVRRSNSSTLAPIISFHVYRSELENSFGFHTPSLS